EYKYSPHAKKRFAEQTGEARRRLRALERIEREVGVKMETVLKHYGKLNRCPASLAKNKATTDSKGTTPIPAFTFYLSPPSTPPVIKAESLEIPAKFGMEISEDLPFDLQAVTDFDLELFSGFPSIIPDHSSHQLSPNSCIFETPTAFGVEAAPTSSFSVQRNVELGNSQIELMSTLSGLAVEPSFQLSTLAMPYPAYDVLVGSVSFDHTFNEEFQDLRANFEQAFCPTPAFGANSWTHPIQCSSIQAPVIASDGSAHLSADARTQLQFESPSEFAGSPTGAIVVKNGLLSPSFFRELWTTDLATPSTVVSRVEVASSNYCNRDQDEIDTADPFKELLRLISAASSKSGAQTTKSAPALRMPPSSSRRRTPASAPCLRIDAVNQMSFSNPVTPLQLESRGATSPTTTTAASAGTLELGCELDGLDSWTWTQAKRDIPVVGNSLVKPSSSPALLATLLPERRRSIAFLQPSPVSPTFDFVLFSPRSPRKPFGKASFF
ncbi:hypothetical protein DFJ73DRAFT_837900, partial [Zopfochytrium polystomum]